MTTNTALFHSLRYRDAAAALDYLAAGLGLERTAAYFSPDDPTRVEHAQMSWPGGGGIMFGSASDGAPTGVAFAYLVLAEDADVDRVHQRALDHGFTHGARAGRHGLRRPGQHRGRPRGQRVEPGVLPRRVVHAGSLARVSSSACAMCPSWFQISARITAEPTKANQNGAVIPHRFASGPAIAAPATMPPITPSM